MIDSNSNTPLGTNDIIFDMFFEGNKFPAGVAVGDKNTGVSMFNLGAAFNNGSQLQSLQFRLYGGTNSNATDNIVSMINDNAVLYGIDVRPYLTNGTNHLAVGRQGGIWQVWINGTRVYRANNSSNTDNITSCFNRVNIAQFDTNGKTLVINDIRLTPNVNIYGDSATITVPSLPLTAI
jgi:hypothetical protein